MLKYIPLSNLSKNNNSTAIVLDIDNTLYVDTDEIKINRYKKIVSYSSLLNLSTEELLEKAKLYNEKYGSALKGVVLHHAKSQGVRDALGTAMQNLEEFITPNTKLKDVLRQFDCHVYCFTNATASHGLNALKALDLCDEVTGLFCADFSQPEPIVKPDPRSYEFVNQFLNFKKQVQKIVFFDDSKVNINTAKSVGWDTFLVDHKKPLDEILFSLLDEIKVLQNINLKL